jgi:hypothetical protein
VVLEARHVGIIHQAIIAEAIRLVPIDAPEVGVEEPSITGLQCANRRLWVTKHRYTRIQELCASCYPKGKVPCPKGLTEIAAEKGRRPMHV